MFTKSNDTQSSSHCNTRSTSSSIDDGTPFPALRRAAFDVLQVAILGLLCSLIMGADRLAVVCMAVAVANVYALWKLSFHALTEDPREAQRCPPSTYWFACDTWLHAFWSITHCSMSDPHGTARWINWAVADTVRCIKWHLRHAVVIEGLCDGLCKTLPPPTP